MSEISKTTVLVVIAGLLVLAASQTYFATQPREVEGFEKVGQPFFADFDDPRAARSLEVTAYDPDTGFPRSFRVTYENGLWRIPSHYGYPAEAADRLAATASSLLGVLRESVAARRESEQERFGVLDPSDDAADADSAGKRITIRDERDQVLVDYIIGKPAGSSVDEVPEMVRDEVQKSDYYHVRVPGEKETYKARIDIDLSTRFTDWIEPDLLKVDTEEINKLEVNSYDLVEEARGQVTKLSRGQFRLTRDGFEPWSMEGLNEITEELDTAQVDNLLSLLDEMEIVGVRPKPTLDGKPLVGSDLMVNQDLFQANPEGFQDQLMYLRQDLEDKGFLIGADRDDPQKLMLLATRGELSATTKNGVAYTLFFGKGVTGDETEIEIGGSSASENESDGENEPADESATDPGTDPAAGGDPAGSGDQPADDDADARNRYVAIRVAFDEAALGEAPVTPVKPVAPQKPEGYDAWKQKQSQADGETDPPPDEDSGAGDPDDAPEPPADVAAETEQKFREFELAQASFEQADIQYTTDLELFETNTDARRQRQEAGQELVKQLNERFAQWYYVVPASSLKTVKLRRDDLVNTREIEPPPQDGPLSPGGGVPQRPDISPPESGEPAPAKPAAATSDPAADDEADTGPTESQDDEPQDDEPQDDEPTDDG